MNTESEEIVTSLTLAVLKREMFTGLAFLGWGIGILILAFVTAHEETGELGFLSWVFVTVIVLTIVSGLLRLIIAKSMSRCSRTLPFAEGHAALKLTASSRIQLIIVTSGDSRELSWDLFSPELSQDRDMGFFLRIDHIGERLLAWTLLAIRVRYVPKKYGKRCYPWMILRLRGVPSLLIRTSKKYEASNYRARLLIIE